MGCFVFGPQKSFGEREEGRGCDKQAQNQGRRFIQSVFSRHFLYAASRLIVVMKYKYTSFLSPNRSVKFTKRPMVEIELIGDGGSQKVLALLDSGADYSLFDYDLAVAAGIDLSKSRDDRLTGIGGETLGKRLDKVDIKVQDIVNAVKIPACFIKNFTAGALIGQEGFFDQYKIKFEKDHDTFEIIPVRK
jgi:hypothetical protein